MTLSSRIFVKGLPPTLTEDDFKKHFSAKQEITDAKLIPHRRIGYVGFKTPDEAVKAVKYFNKTFMRMSRIEVELARPISDKTLPISRKVQREHKREVRQTEKVQEAAKATSSSGNSSLKRKRSDVDKPDPKLKEFLGLMLPKSQMGNLPNLPSQVEDKDEPPKKMQAIELPEAESDGEYEMIPRKPKKELQSTAVPFSSTAPTTDVLPEVAGQEQAPISLNKSEKVALAEIDGTDDDWLRSRTSRLLDLVEPTDLAALEPVQEEPNASPQSDKPTPLLRKDQVGEPIVIDERANETEIEESHDPTFEAVKISGRLFVRNLPYSATEDDLRKYFATYGALEEIHLPLDGAGRSKGFVLVQFEDPSAAAEAYHNVDGEPFQGRLLHILPAEMKRKNKLDEFAIAKLPLKKQKLIKKKAEASLTTFNWNSLYMNQDAVNSSIADRLGVSKADLLDPTSADAGVKQAIAETSIIQETKAYFAKSGVDLHAFKKQERGDTTILVKNFPYGMTLDELRKMFEEFGQVLRVLMPPTGTIAIVEFAQAPQARAAFANLAYRRLKDSVLFLEKAPKDLFVNASVDDVSVVQKEKNSADPKISIADLLERDTAITSGDTSTLFIRNLNFETTSARLTEIFKPLDGFMSARVNTKTNPKKPGHVLSMGFGFVEFRTKVQAQAALASLNGYSLDNHKLIIKASHKGMDAAEERAKADKAKKLSGRRTKIIIKNLPFEATKKDVRALFGTYGQLRSVRVPKKFDSSARGFAFADFITPREAENALEALKDTHLLGRRLVLEFASEDPVDAEEEIEKMQKKVGKQVNKVALQKLTGGGRKKFNVEGDENEGV